MHYRCFICHRPPCGFGWLNPSQKQTAEHRRENYKRFCSKACQDIYFQLHHKGMAMNRTDLEQNAVESVLGPLADYVIRVGMEKGLGNYSKAEIVGLVDTVLEAYHTALQTLYKNEVPF